MSAAITGTRDTTFNLLSVLYHRLQEAETLAQYITDAEKAGDDELAEFLRQLLDADREHAEKAKDLLQARLGTRSGGPARIRPKAKDEVDQASIDSFPASDAPANY